MPAVLDTADEREPGRRAALLAPRFLSGAPLDSLSSTTPSDNRCPRAS